MCFPMLREIPAALAKGKRRYESGVVEGFGGSKDRTNLVLQKAVGFQSSIQPPSVTESRAVRTIVM